jgi:hypothetical protein
MSSSTTPTDSPLKGKKRPGLHPSQAWFEGTLKARKARGQKPAELKTFKEQMLARHAHLKAPGA